MPHRRAISQDYPCSHREQGFPISLGIEDQAKIGCRVRMREDTNQTKRRTSINYQLGSLSYIYTYSGCTKTFRYSNVFFYKHLCRNSLFRNILMKSGINCMNTGCQHYNAEDVEVTCQRPKF